MAILAIYTGHHQRNGLSEIQGHVPKDVRITEKPLDGWLIQNRPLTMGMLISIFNVYTQVLNMRTRIKKWGNSLDLRIPKTFADEINLKENSSIEMMMQDGTLLITPVTEREWTLEELLSGVTDENRRHEWETGPAEGEETW